MCVTHFDDDDDEDDDDHKHALIIESPKLRHHIESHKKKIYPKWPPFSFFQTENV